MFKGTPLKNRNKAWHTKHMARLKKRKAHREERTARSRILLKKSRAMSKKYNAKEAEQRKLLEKDVGRGKLYWLFVRWRGRVLSVFNKVANKIKSLFKKPNAIKAKA
ncbi:hypothetical protein LCGC14_0828680 [marine sediment metagenome]|uniref:Uncharacterized protein n=1 Tax=marine sediment metagenome TaxID=412755 RepID=A0A0F9PLC2_9ZZZZ